MKNESRTHFLKRHIKQYLQMNSDKEINLIEIRDHISDSLNEDFSPGMYSSAMRDLTEEKESKIVNLSRGVYIYVKSKKKVEINKVLDDTIEKLKNVAVISYLEINDLEERYLKEIPRLIAEIENMKINY